MFWLRNKKNNCSVCTLILRPVYTPPKRRGTLFLVWILSASPLAFGVGMLMCKNTILVAPDWYQIFMDITEA